MSDWFDLARRRVTADPELSALSDILLFNVDTFPEEDEAHCIATSPRDCLLRWGYDLKHHIREATFRLAP